MSRTQIIAGAMAAATLVGAVAGCSDGSQDSASTSRAAMAFGTTEPASSPFELCSAYPIDAVKAIVGGGNRFQAQPAGPIEGGDGEVFGEACSWERQGPGEQSRLLRVEARDFDIDTAGLEAQFDELRTKTVAASTLEDIGDEAFTATSKDASLVQIRKGTYLITASSRVTGSLEPIPISKLVAIAGTSFGQLP